jgi:sarcosine oxidase subunit alpha
VNAALSRFLPAGFYYKTFMYPRPFWKHVFEPFIRQSAGLGKAPDPKHSDPDRYEHFYAHVDIVVAGGGIAGLQAALEAGRAGAKVLVCEQTAHWGGRAPVDGVTVDGAPAEDWIAAAVAELEGMENVHLRLRTMVAGVYDHGYVLAYERVSDHAPQDGVPRHRLWRIRTGQVVSAIGAIERPLSFAGNDKPGVMLAAAMRDYVTQYGVSPGDRTVVVTNNDDAYRTAIALKQAGLDVPCIVDARPKADGPLPQEARAMGIPVKTGTAIAGVKGIRGVVAVQLCNQAGEGAVTEEVVCEAVAMSGGWSPAVHLWSHCGGKLTWDEDGAFFRPDPARPPTDQHGAGFVVCAGASDGALHASEVMENAARSARKALESSGKPATARSRPGRCARRGADGPRLAHAAGRGGQETRQDVARFPERREGLRRATGRARGLMKASSTPSATPRSAWRRIRGNSAISTASPCLLMR